MSAIAYLTDPAARCFITYPHAQGFLPDGRLVVGSCGDGELARLWALSPDGTCAEQIVEFPWLAAGPDEVPWFDIARLTGKIAVNLGERLLILRPSGSGGWTQEEYACGPGSARRGGVPSITAGGEMALVDTRGSGGSHEFSLVELASGTQQTVLDKPWFANHFHFCPYDESWIGFCHEGPAEEIADRVWAWHAEAAPKGRPLFDQAGSGLFLGHERWCFHETSALAVAFGISPGGPRGIYRLRPDGRLPELVSEGNRDWHVNISQDGKWAVVDTSGPHDAPGRGWERAGTHSDILLIDMADGRRTHLARVRRGAAHPCHPHPAFSPDGRWIYFNEPDRTGRSQVARVANPLAAQVV